ncbi:N-acetyllactosaminide 3-alpha-galactosyltransferase [Ostertagia ostertagi]
MESKVQSGLWVKKEGKVFRVLYLGCAETAGTGHDWRIGGRNDTAVETTQQPHITNEKKLKLLKRFWKGTRGRVVVFFILSIPHLNGQLDKILQEQYEYRDIIATDLTDSYQNLFQKIRPISKPPVALSSENQFHMQTCVSLEKIYSGYVPKSVWPSKYYPAYCNGPFYVMGNETVKEIAEMSLYFTPFIMEDVFYTGVVAGALNIPTTNWTNRITHLLEPSNRLTATTLIKTPLNNKA